MVCIIDTTRSGDFKVEVRGWELRLDGSFRFYGRTDEPTK